MARSPNLAGAVLAGSWRAEPEPLEIDAARLDGIADVLISTGAGGLAWRRIARTPGLGDAAAAARIRDCARMQAISAVRDDEALAALCGLFEEAGVQPLLFKGRAAASHYAERHLRPMGDADLCAPPGGMDALASILTRRGFVCLSSEADADRGRVLGFSAPADWPGSALQVDLHEHLGRFYLTPLEDVFGRAGPLKLGSHSILVPAPEDHLRLVALHFLLHGGWRALSLCDVAAMAESAAPEFDWDLCLGPVARRRGWITGTLSLARRILGARTDPVTLGLDGLVEPDWFRATVDEGLAKHFSAFHPRPVLGRIWRDRWYAIPAEYLARWPNPIRATVELDAGFTSGPRWPYQLAHFSRSTWRRAAAALKNGTP